MSLVRPERFELYATLAQEINTSEGALTVAIHRLRKRYRELFRQEIADTVADPSEVESERRYLEAVLYEEVTSTKATLSRSA